ncbi:MAG: dCMP deaminase family protein [Solobacterium sp.]|nr:dCMP deaminase family protein [Solobacterium sp.]MCH4205076.1 dCMP deaminase family protein [Solobacterium sp.]MCH4226585.1 dCMP deaminase family protein [Solobacterium sp.]MCH4281869.1 dCMP deaminase family protein [Solobacterium sp.]
MDQRTEDVLSWDEYFMGLAHLSALRSKDPSTQVGAAIVDENHRVVSVGYNGFPSGVSDADFPWQRVGGVLESKYAFVVHAELNAILNSQRSVRGCTIYVSLFPCNECAKAIIQSGIKKIVYESDKYNGTDTNIASKRMLKAAGVELVRISNTISLHVDKVPNTSK